MKRCPCCFRPEDAYHRLLGHCQPAERPPERSSERPPRTWDQRGYVPPSRSHRIPRADWLASVRVTISDEERRARGRERQRRYRERLRAAAA